MINSIAPDGAPYQLVTLTNSQGMKVVMTDWGATWLSCSLPVNGQTREVLLGCKSLTDYQKQTAYLGATVGRYANRIKNSLFSIDDIEYHLNPNQGPHQLHGGVKGFDKKRWRIIQNSAHQVIFELISPDGEEGFPGNVNVRAMYELTDDNQVRIDYFAKTDKKTIVNLTNHAYFNLDGDGCSILDHTLQVNADYFLPVNSEGIPEEKIAPVAEGDMDLNQPRKIKERLLDSSVRKITKGYDHGYLLSPKLGVAAQLTSSDKKVIMEVLTTKPALQVYTGNFLAGVINREGKPYGDYAGVALESGFLADTPNHPEWIEDKGQSCFVSPGRDYHFQTIYRFKSA